MSDKRLTPAREQRVTIAVPCFKQEAFLFECLNSLIAQTMPSWQAFVVDDCSPAGTAQRIASSYNDFRIRCIRHDVNRGLSASRNTGLQAGCAPFVLCIDADDFLHPDFLSATLEAIKDGGADCAYTEFQLVGLSNEVWAWDIKTPDEMAVEQWVPGPGVVMRRSVWEQVGGYSEELRWNEDWDFWIAAIHLGFSFQRVPRPLYSYRLHADSMTATLSAKSERTSRGAILKKRAEFFAIGDRAKRFRAGGLLRSAYANRVAGDRRRWAALTAQAISVDPRLIYPEAKAVVQALARKAKKTITSIATTKSENHRHSNKNANDLPLRDWDSLVFDLHNRYGHLSHDFSVLGQVIEKTKAHSVLEVGCGSGRLVPVYLAHNIPTILLQDISVRALDLCRQRFFCQEHIRYFHGDVQTIPTMTSPDLIVANRVLQHILEDKKFYEMMNYLTSMARYFYINEAGIEQAKSINSPYLKGRDYAIIFYDLGWRVADRGELIAEFGTRQSWMLFTK